MSSTAPSGEARDHTEGWPPFGGAGECSVHNISSRSNITSVIVGARGGWPCSSFCSFWCCNSAAAEERRKSGPSSAPKPACSAATGVVGSDDEDDDEEEDVDRDSQAAGGHGQGEVCGGVKTRHRRSSPPNGVYVREGSSACHPGQLGVEAEFQHRFPQHIGHCPRSWRGCALLHHLHEAHEMPLGLHQIKLKLIWKWKK